MLLIKALRLAWHFLSLWDYLCFINITTQTFSDRFCFGLEISSKNLCPECSVHQELEIWRKGLGNHKSLDRREELPNYRKISKHGISRAPNAPFISADLWPSRSFTDGAATFLLLTWAKLVSVVMDLCFRRKYIKYHGWESLLILLLSNWKCII